MFDVGFWELALIGIVALLIIGPQRLPGAAHTAGLWIGKGRRMLRDAKADIDRELRAQNVADMAKAAVNQVAKVPQDVRKVGQQFQQSAHEIKAPFDDLKKTLTPANPAPGNTAPTPASPSTGESYWLYVMPKHKSSSLHRADCCNCNYGAGQQRKGTTPARENDQWHGPFSRTAAEQKRHAIGMQNNRDCGTCKPEKIADPHTAKIAAKIADTPA